MICKNCGHEKRNHTAFSGCIAKNKRTGKEDCECERFKEVEIKDD